jgi:hypothetical protein
VVYTADLLYHARVTVDMAPGGFSLLFNLFEGNELRNDINWTWQKGGIEI